MIASITTLLEMGAQVHTLYRKGDDLMRFNILSLTVLAFVGLNSYAGAGDRPGPVRTVTPESGVVPPGTSLVVRANDTVSTNRALRGTIYDASMAQEVLDQHGSVLIPKGSPVDLVVRSLPYLGPGGVGMTEMIVEVGAITVNGVRYPVETQIEEPNAGGLGIDRLSAKWVGGGEVGGPLFTVGSRINVPAGALLEFQIRDPIRLRGYQR